ncbi:MAG: nucleotidyltransferase domain-containing protein [Lachnospiraceae bacterium]|nr:nucleotidyltransferase domain-containing protein [Lachnospiraceae bacterium]
MNTHSDEWIIERLREHLEDALKLFPKDQIVGIFYVGSGNYGLDTEFSDVDTEVIVAPSFHDIAFNKTINGKCHIRENGEYITPVDIRFAMRQFRKQNSNFMEILFTKYKWINPIYDQWWFKLSERKELIAHYSPIAAAKTARGIAAQCYNKIMKATEEYNRKDLYHLIRISDFLTSYIGGYPYEECLRSHSPVLLKDIKTRDLYDLNTAKSLAESHFGIIKDMTNSFSREGKYKEEIDKLLNDVQEKIVMRSLLKELNLWGAYISNQEQENDV